MSDCLSLLHELTIFIPPSHFVVLQLWQKKKGFLSGYYSNMSLWAATWCVYYSNMSLWALYDMWSFFGSKWGHRKKLYGRSCERWTWCGNYYYNLVSIFMKWKLTWHILESLGVENLNGNSLWSVNAWGGEMKWVSKFFLFLEIITICC